VDWGLKTLIIGGEKAEISDLRLFSEGWIETLKTPVKKKKGFGNFLVLTGLHRCVFGKNVFLGGYWLKKL